MKDELFIIVLCLMPVIANYWFTGNIVVVNAVVTIAMVAIAVTTLGYVIVKIGRDILGIDDKEES